MAIAEHNKAAPGGGSDCLQVLQVTDTHLYGEVGERLVGIDTEASYRQVLAKLKSGYWPADLVLATGDISQDGSAESYRRFKADFEQLRTPTLVIPGNHDRPEVLREVMRGGRVTCADHSVLGNWQFVMLDSTLADSNGGHLADDQLELLDRRLSAHPELHALVCLHHHPVTVACDWIDPIGVDNGEQLFAVLDRHPQVRAVVWGHIHQDFNERRNGVELIATPSTCIQFKPRQKEFALDDVAPGFRWLRLYPDGGIETAVERIESLSQDLDLRCSGY